MKIFQVIQKPQLRGAEIFAAQLGEHLLRLGHQVVLVSIFPGDAVLPFSGISIRLDRDRKFRLFDITGWWIFSSLVRSHGPDMIQANAADTLKFTVFSKILFGWHKPILYRNANTISGFIDSRLKLLFNKFIISRAAAIISVSKSCNDDCIRLFKYPVGRSFVIPVGIEIEPLAAGSTNAEQIYCGVPVLINVAGMVPEKNQVGLLKIFAKVRAEFPRAILLMVGKGRLMKILKTLSIELGISGAVHFLGNRNDVLNLMQKSDMLVLPSLIEGLPGVILEAMSVNCPVVAYAVGGVPEVIHNLKTGILVEPGDENGFIEGVKLLLNDRKLRQMITRAAKKLVTQEFDNTEIASRFEQAYLEILSSSELSD